MIVGITGHRNCTADIETLRNLLAGATLVLHGGANGFDQQAAHVAELMDIPTETIRPDYKANGRAAPFIRNRQIVDRCDVLIACYDGRTTGGTLDTIRYAQKRTIPIYYAR